MNNRSKWVAYWVQFWREGGTLAQKTAATKAGEYYDASPSNSAKANAFIAEVEGVGAEEGVGKLVSWMGEDGYVRHKVQVKGSELAR